MSPIVQGLVVSAVGIVILFVFASIFYGLIVLLQKLFPFKAEEPEAVEVPAAAAAEPVLAVEDTSEEDALVAALAVAMAQAKARIQSGLGDALHNGRSTWWSANLMATRNSRR